MFWTFRSYKHQSSREESSTPAFSGSGKLLTVFTHNQPYQKTPKLAMKFISLVDFKASRIFPWEKKALQGNAQLGPILCLLEVLKYWAFPLNSSAFDF